MTTHTPGPWCFRKDIVYGGPDEEPVCVMNYELTPELMAANARLIAKAPELLDLCERAIRALSEDDFPSLRDDLREAINQATGD